MPLHGDFSEIQNLVSDVSEFSDNAWPEAAKAAKQEIEAQYALDFSAQRGPDGDPWQTKGNKTPKLIGETLRLSNPTITLSGGVVRVRPVYYWVFQQFDGNHVLPFYDSIWDTAIEQRITLRVNQLLPKG